MPLYNTTHDHHGYHSTLQTLSVDSSSYPVTQRYYNSTAPEHAPVRGTRPKDRPLLFPGDGTLTGSQRLVKESVRSLSEAVRYGRFTRSRHPQPAGTMDDALGRGRKAAERGSASDDRRIFLLEVRPWPGSTAATPASQTLLDLARAATTVS